MSKTVTFANRPRSKKFEPDPSVQEAMDAFVEREERPEPEDPPATSAQEAAVPQTQDREEEPQIATREKGRGRSRSVKPGMGMKRFSIDLPADLHKRMKRACLEKDIEMSVELRRILERHFPANKRA